MDASNFYLWIMNNAFSMWKWGGGGVETEAYVKYQQQPKRRFFFLTQVIDALSMDFIV